MAYIGLELSRATSRKLSGLVGAQLHITLAHFEKPSNLVTAEIAAKLAQLASGAPPPELLTTSIEIWEVGPVALLEHTTQLEVLRWAAVTGLEASGVEVSKHHDYRPHITLGTLGVQLDAAFFGKVIVTGLELCGCSVITRYVFPFQERFHV